MKILTVFDAILDGTYEDFINFYDGNISEENQHTNLNLLLTALLNDKNPNDKLRIIEYLISEGVDINYVDSKYKRNALHTFFFNVVKGPTEYMEQVVELLVNNGVSVNQLDKYDAIPLKYAITNSKKTTEDLEQTYRFLLEQGSNYKHKDTFGKSCLDYAKEYSWRNGFIDIVEEYKNEIK